MKQVLQSLKTGVAEVMDVPAPGARPNHLLIRTRASLISAGTERMLTDFGKANLLEKVRQQPDKVRQVVDKMRTDGVVTTLEAVRAKLDQPIPMGYCNVGEVLAVGPGVEGFAIGDRVLSNGAHAEVVNVPHTLCAKVPDGISDEAASFAVLGAIGLQGIRLAEPTFGEAFVVTGLGLIGLLTVQLLRANGCRVLGIDVNAQRLALARSWGAETVDVSNGGDPVAAALAFSRGRGVDGVLVTAATASSEPIHQAALMSRKRGRIVLVGVTGLELSRADFYEKELSFQVSCSYGPGRYDPDYEQKGQDYPLAFVRWTEQRNFEAVLDSMACGGIDTAPLTTHRFDIERAGEAYAALEDRAALGIILTYPVATPAPTSRRVDLAPHAAASGTRVGIIGAGNYSTRVLGPAFQAAGAAIAAIAANSGASAAIMARKQRAAVATTDPREILGDPDIDGVVIATPHSSHANYVVEALRRGKHVFVEKPLALHLDDVDRIETLLAELAAEGRAPMLTVGFNRRFSPLTVALKRQLSGAPKSLILTINAGAIPATHWTQDPAVGGGRIVGEACHFIDLARHLVGAPIVDVTRRFLGPAGSADCGDTASIILSFEDGSVASINYFANGSKSYPKERVEVFDNGRVFAIENFRRLTAHGGTGQRLMSQDKGQEALVQHFVAAMRGGPAPIDIRELMEVSRASIIAAQR